MKRRAYTKLHSDELGIKYVLNWIYCGGRIGRPYDWDKNFIAWLRSELDDDDVDRVLKIAHKYDSHISENAKAWLSENDNND